MGNRTILLTALVIFSFLSSLLAPATGQALLDEGDPVPAFTLEKRGGGSVTLPDAYKGKVVFVNFWAAWCPECKVELPELSKVQKKFETRPFVLVTVNVDRKRKGADKFLEKIKTDLLVLYNPDQKVIRAFGPVGMPASYLIGPDGRVKKKYMGFKPEFIEKYITDIEAELEAMPAEKAGSE